jgi:putative DNA primase/helicase
MNNGRITRPPTLSPVKIVGGTGRKWSPDGPSNPEVLPPEFSEEALALRFSARHASELRYVAAAGKWFLWDGTKWAKERTLKVFDFARAICRQMCRGCAPEGLARRLASAVTVGAVERLARSDRRHAATLEQWDADPWLLNTPAGTVDLHTGKIRPHQSQDYLTKVTAVGPGPVCPLWLAFLRRVTGEDPQLEAYLQRIAGYCLTGTTQEHALFFFYGHGANGKSVFITTLSELMGDYSKVAAMDTFMASSGERHPTDLAGLQGARLVTAVETEEGRRWAEAKLKALTGGDKISARFMRQDFFEFTPQFKLLIAGNHKPGLRTVDEAMRRRLQLVPFAITIPETERDPELTQKLKGEWPGILAWTIEGCLAWQQEGLNPPPTARLATEEYLEAEDAVGRWMEERAILGRQYFTASTALYHNWRQWCEEAGEPIGSQKEFSMRLERFTQLEKCRSNRVRGFKGIALKQDVREREG